ncbi:hypothetical protein LMG27174_06055 [Paraburkholderia rhynchosiae]|uniref:Uncharacterized protein n=1 Tax=Paraburkholderia rhynchosiae TaxID=487049 RepID=A0A6J5CFQ7_9BURK|nr:hypothetical protein LMG27174_06055 [Paraburkholderia rhynchosiae]
MAAYRSSTVFRRHSVSRNQATPRRAPPQLERRVSVKAPPRAASTRNCRWIPTSVILIRIHSRRCRNGYVRFGQGVRLVRTGGATLEMTTQNLWFTAGGAVLRSVSSAKQLRLWALDTVNCRPDAKAIDGCDVEGFSLPREREVASSEADFAAPAMPVAGHCVGRRPTDLIALRCPRAPEIRRRGIAAIAHNQQSRSQPTIAVHSRAHARALCPNSVGRSKAHEGAAATAVSRLGTAR